MMVVKYLSIAVVLSMAIDHSLIAMQQSAPGIDEKTIVPGDVWVEVLDGIFLVLEPLPGHIERALGALCLLQEEDEWSGASACKVNRDRYYRNLSLENAGKLALKNGDLYFIKRLCSEGINICEIVPEVLYVAVECGHLETVRYLVEHCKINVHVTNSLGLSACDVAARLGHLEIVQYLVETFRLNVNVTGFHGLSVLSFAQHNGHVKVVNYLRSRGAR